MLRRLLQRTGKRTENSKSQSSVAPSSASANPIERARNASTNKARSAAISEIDDVATLKTLATTPSLTTPCADRLVELDELALALALVDTADARIELAIACHQGALKTALIVQLQHESELLDLEHRSRNRNKPTNRAARTQLDALRSARTDAAEAHATTRVLSQQVKRLDADEHLLARYETLRGKWQAAQDQWQQARDLLEAFQESPEPLVQLPECPASVPTSAKSAATDFTALAEEFQGVRAKLAAGEPAARLSETMGRLSQLWHAGIKEATPDRAAIDPVKACTRLFEASLSAQQRLDAAQESTATLLKETDADALLQADFENAANGDLPALWELAAQARTVNRAATAIFEQVRWPGELPQPPLLSQLSQRHTAVQRIIEASRQRIQQLERALDGHLSEFQQALDAGKAREAERARQQSQLLMNALPGDPNKRLTQQFSALQGKLHQIRDWQQFATEPKRDELVAAIEQLAAHPVNPTDQATEVKALREQWRELGGRGPKELAQRFEIAAQKAFEPARKHFAQLAEERTQNLAKREAIVAQLQEYLATTDWSSADMTAAQGILNTARDAWRAAFPVERGPNRAIEKRFNAATDQLYANLRAHWNDNLAQKESLANEAQALLTTESPLPERLERAKALQTAWKQSGSAPRGQEQRLWKQFRKACDELFAQRDQQRQAQIEERNAQSGALNARIDAFEGTLDGAQLPRNHFASFEAELREMGQPDPQQRNRVSGLRKRCEAQLAQQAARARAHKLDELKRLDSQCAQCEINHTNIPDTTLDSHPIFGKRQPPQLGNDRDLVLEAEWLAEIDPPDTDRQRRMELQVIWMNQGMNAGARLEADPMTLAERWCQYCATEHSDELRERLFDACAQLLAKS